MSFETLVIGGGGREHVLGQMLDRQDDVTRVLGVNGNLGIEQLDKGENVTLTPNERATFDDLVVDLVEDRDVGFVVIGPEVPIIDGLGDRLRANNRLVFAPSAEAARRTEGSKIETYEFNERHGIPQPPSVVFRPGQAAAAMEHVISRDPESYVIKADGIAGGKGVVLPDTKLEAMETIEKMFTPGGFDGAGKNGILIADRFHGPEVSAFVISDGKNIKVLPFAQDHKRIGEGDTGPNTGGMGAYAPLPRSMVNPYQAAQIEGIAQQVIDGMAAEGEPYQGCLYMGMMLAEEMGGDPVVIEYNCRFGDPEAQVVLPLLHEAGVDTFELLRSAAEGNLSDVYIPSNLGKSALTICLASAGYPASSSKGDVIEGLDQLYSNVDIYHGGTKLDGAGRVVTNGGRVLYITGYGETIDEAAERAYAAVEPSAIAFPGMQYRRDIGWQIRTSNAA